MKAFPKYWGPKPYYTTVNMPVIDDLSTEEIEFNDGQIDAILHDMTSSVIAQYKDDSKVALYTLPTLQSEVAYVNENKGFLTKASNRLDLLEAINLKYLVASVFPGRGTVPSQAGPAGIIPSQYGQQNIPYDPSKLQKLAKTLSAADKNFVVGYDTGAPDDELLAEDIGLELSADGLKADVVGYETSDIFGWVGSVPDARSKSTPNVLVDYFWPDTYNTYAWTHISFDPSGGLEYLACNLSNEAALDSQAVATGSDVVYNKAIENAVKSGCWLNLADKDDTMVAQPWLKGIAAGHIVADPEMLELDGLYPGRP
jgi:peptide/nickel transport system substrate-binding protein